MLDNLGGPSSASILDDVDDVATDSEQSESHTPASSSTQHASLARELDDLDFSTSRYTNFLRRHSGK